MNSKPTIWQRFDTASARITIKLLPNRQHTTAEQATRAELIQALRTTADRIERQSPTNGQQP